MGLRVLGFMFSVSPFFSVPQTLSRACSSALYDDSRKPVDENPNLQNRSISGTLFQPQRKVTAWLFNNTKLPSEFEIGCDFPHCIGEENRD